MVKGIYCFCCFVLFLCSVQLSCGCRPSIDGGWLTRPAACPNMSNMASAYLHAIHECRPQTETCANLSMIIAMVGSGKPSICNHVTRQRPGQSDTVPRSHHKSKHQRQPTQDPISEPRVGQGEQNSQMTHLAHSQRP